MCFNPTYVGTMLNFLFSEIINHFDSSPLEISPNPKDKKEKTITISYLGMAFFLQNLYNKLN